jgi:hypothetical protein
MTTYGISNYGRPNLYGPSRAATVVPGGPSIPLVNNAYLIDPFVATPIDYHSVLLTWHGPDPTTDTPMNEFRLLSSRYGFPVDENDGNILLDTTSLPGTQFVDQTVVPGQISYYGFYILGANSQWIRSGFTACLMPVNHGYATQLWSYLPEYLRDVQDNELTADAAGDTFLSQFLAVAGWSMDYLKTQYDFLFSNQNAPMKMSFTDLADLAGEIGMPFSGEIPAYFLRKAAANWATVMRQRGSLSGISEHMSLLSGYTADVQISRNIMLENDQSLPFSPQFSPWSAGIPYLVGEIVSWPVYPEWVPSQSYIVNNFVVYNGVNYGCIATGGEGVPPTGALTSGTYWTIESGPFFYECTAAITSLPGTAPPAAPAAGLSPNPSNSNWQLVYDQDATASYLAITGLSGGLNTWEVLGATTGSATPKTTAVAAGSLTEGIGTHNPANFANDFSQNTLRVYNKSGAVEDTWLRSLSRMAADITAGSAVPDPQTVIEHAIPVPQTNATLNEWSATERYATGDVVLWGGRNYLAQRASTGATPPALGVPVNQNWDFETSASPWAAGNGGSAIAQSAAHAYHGTHSLSLTPSGTQAAVSAVSEKAPVIPLASYTARAFVFVTAGYAGGNTQALLNWYDAFGSYISTSAVGGIAVPAATWTRVTVSAQAPANAATATIVLQLTGTPAASVVSFWDLAKLTCTATPEWLPLGTDARIPLMISAQTSQNLSVAPAEQFAIYPFVEWYDNWGNLITRVFARTLSNYTFDSFSSDANMPLGGRMTQTQDQTWSTATGAWMLDGNGNAYPAVSGQKSISLVQAALSCTQAVTFTEAPQTGVDAGLIFWYQTATLYWHAGTHGLWYNNGGTWTEAVTYASAFQPGDRIYVVTSQATPSITVYRNSLTSTPVASLTGAGVPAAVKPGSSTTVYSGIASEAV